MSVFDYRSRDVLKPVFSPDTDFDTCAVGIGQYRAPTPIPVCYKKNDDMALLNAVECFPTFGGQLFSYN